MRILLVEDDAVLRDVMLRSLADAGHRVDVASTVADTSHLWRVQRFDAVLLDLNLPEGGGPAPFELPAREFEVLRELMTPPGRVVSKRLLSDKLSGLEDSLGDNALEAFISRLRKKLAGTGATIRTLRGLGYLVEAESAE